MQCNFITYIFFYLQAHITNGSHNHLLHSPHFSHPSLNVHFSPPTQSLFFLAKLVLVWGLSWCVINPKGTRELKEMEPCLRIYQMSADLQTETGFHVFFAHLYWDFLAHLSLGRSCACCYNCCYKFVCSYLFVSQNQLSCYYALSLFLKR